MGRASIVYPSQVWFMGGQPGFLLYTPAESGSWGWSVRVSIVYPSQIWFMGVVSQGFYCKPLLSLICGCGQPGDLLLNPVEYGLYIQYIYHYYTYYTKRRFKAT